MSHQPTAAVEYEQFCERGVRYAYSILRNMADAEEAVQEALCRLLRQHRTPASLSQHAAVYFKIVRNLCIDQLRYRQRFEPLVTEPADPRGSTDGFAAGTGAAGELDALQDRISVAIASLPESWAAALRLRVDAGLRYDEIAGVLDCTPAQVRTWIFRARRQLEREFDDVLTAEERP